MLQLTENERNRIDQVIEVALNGNWEQFRELSDKPFRNEDSMREQFVDSSSILKSLNGKWIEEDEVKYNDDDTRVLFVKLIPSSSKEENINITLHSTTGDDRGEISIWTFHQDVDWTKR